VISQVPVRALNRTTSHKRPHVAMAIFTTNGHNLWKTRSYAT